MKKRDDQTPFASRLEPPPPNKLPIPIFTKKGGKLEDIEGQYNKKEMANTVQLLLPSLLLNSSPKSVNPGIIKQPTELSITRAERRGGSLVSTRLGCEPIWSCYNRHQFSLSTDAVEGGRWCDKCTESFGERKIRLHLEELDIDYRCEMTFPSLVSKEQLRFDFYIPSVKLFIEMDGEQHFLASRKFKGTLLSRLLRDQVKDEWADNGGFSVLRIPYWELDSVEEKINETIDKIMDGDQVYIAVDGYVAWRAEAIARLKIKKRAPLPPIPINATQRVMDARAVIREEIETELEEMNYARSEIPDHIDIA